MGTPRRGRKSTHETLRQSRREFLASGVGLATTLATIELVNGCAGKRIADLGTVPDAGATPDGMGEIDAASAGPTAGRAGGSEPGHITLPPPEERPDAAPAQPAGDGGDASGPPDAASGSKGCLPADGRELVIDMQTYVFKAPDNPIGITPDFAAQYDLRHPWIVRMPGCRAFDCLDRDAYAELVLDGSDTFIGVLAGLPYMLGNDGLGSSGYAAISNEHVRDAKDALLARFPGRVLAQASVMPNDRIDLQLEVMTRNVEHFDYWRLDPAWRPDARGGFWLTDEVGRRTLQRGIDLGKPIFCVRKGMPQSGHDSAYTSPQDIGEAAVAFPDARLVVLHSAFEHGFAVGESSRPDPDDPDADLGWGPGVGRFPEGPYDEQDSALQARYPLDRGVNALVHSLRRAGIGPNGSWLDGSDLPATHVYAECSEVWAELMVGRPLEAMHYFGKLLKHVGEDRILWGTGSLLYGSPQILIDTFLRLEISSELQERYAYPALTPARKAKILGHNAARMHQVLPRSELIGCGS